MSHSFLYSNIHSQDLAVNLQSMVGDLIIAVYGKNMHKCMGMHTFCKMVQQGSGCSSIHMCIFSLMGTPASYQQESSTTIVPVGKQSTRFPKSILVPPKESITAKTHISGFQRSALYVFMSCRIARRHVSQHSTVSPVETNQLI